MLREALRRVHRFSRKTAGLIAAVEGVLVVQPREEMRGNRAQFPRESLSPVEGASKLTNRIAPFPLRAPFAA